jgi:hypothetical protein
MKKAVLAVMAASAAISTAVAVAASSPAVGTGSASRVSEHGAILHGAVNPNGSSTTFFFQFGLTNAYGVNGRPLSAGGGDRTGGVFEGIGGLSPGTVYHYRLVAVNRYGTTVGADRAFKTKGHPPAVAVTGPPSGVNASSGTLSGAINPEGAATTWWFQWGGSPALGEETAHGVIRSRSPAQTVTMPLQSLLNQGTLYYYRLVAVHPDGTTSVGAIGSFLTFPVPRPFAHVRAATGPRRSRHRPYVLSTSGALSFPSWMPSTYACTGIVTIRLFSGHREVAFTLAGVQPNCTFGAQTVFRRLPGRRPRRPVHLRIVVRYVSTPYLATHKARLEHVTLG